MNAEAKQPFRWKRDGRKNPGRHTAPNTLTRAVLAAEIRNMAEDLNAEAADISFLDAAGFDERACHIRNMAADLLKMIAQYFREAV